MKTPCSEIRVLIDRFLDGDITGDERLGIEEHLDRCPECRAATRSDSELERDLAELPDVSCPDSVVRRIEEATVGQPTPTSWIERLRAFLTPHRWGVVLPALLASTIILLFVIVGRPDRNSGTQPSAPEIRLAEKQARWALSYVVQKIDEDGKQRTGEFVQHDLPVAIRNRLNEAIPILRGD